jgi:DNA polymerase-3 subunit delta'
VLTTSEPGALLPTIRSRVVAVRVPPLGDAAVHAFVTDPTVAAGLAALGVRGEAGSLVARAGGAPGRLLAGAEEQAADAEAERLLRLVLGGSRADRLQGAASQGVSKARGSFSDMLDALGQRLGALSRQASASDGPPGSPPCDAPRALAAARGVEAVERAKQRAGGNVNPQLVTAELLRELAGELGGERR